MKLFRISSAKYSSSLSSSGTANRWNKNGQFVIYTGSSRSLSTLELIVHKSSIRPKMDYNVLIIHIGDGENLLKQVKIEDLPSNWKSVSAYPALQSIGSDWYKNKDSLVLKVPSAIIPQEYNYIINTKHPEFGTKVNLISKEDYFWDSRLLNYQ